MKRGPRNDDAMAIEALVEQTLHTEVQYSGNVRIVIKRHPALKGRLQIEAQLVDVRDGRVAGILHSERSVYPSANYATLSGELGSCLHRLDSSLMARDAADRNEHTA